MTDDTWVDERAEAGKQRLRTFRGNGGTLAAIDFKHEDEDRGMALGPVHVYSQEYLDEALAGPVVVDLPFGVDPPGMFYVGWYPMSGAYEMAELLDLELSEA